MIILDIIIAVIVGILFTAIIASTSYRGAGWGILISLFLIFFLVPWAGALWITPFGPPLFGAYWLPSAVIGLFLLFLILAIVPSSGRRSSGSVSGESSAGEIAAVFLWILLAVAVIAIIIGYVS